MNDLKAKILEQVSRIQENDHSLAEEFQQVRKNNTYQKEAGDLAKKLPVSEAALEGGLESVNDDQSFMLETIVLRVGRPVLAIAENTAVLEFKDAESEVWKERLVNAKSQLFKAIQSVGRIELQNHPSYDWVGTGWLVDKNVIVTNRHVAEVFGKNSGTGFVFRQGSDGTSVKASIDFLEEIDRTAEFVFRCTAILHIEPEPGPDMAFLKVEAIGGKQIPGRINLSSSATQTKQDIAVIGYPARDSRIPDQQLMTDIFGNVYDKKRLAPGQVIGVSDKQLLHDCSTLGGNSGSVLLDLKTGEAVGLHFAGRFLESNFAVPSSLIKNQLNKLGNGPIVTPGSSNKKNKEDVPPGTPSGTNDGQKTISVNYTIPLNITFSVGSLNQSDGPVTVAIGTASNQGKEENEEFFTEGKPEDYTDRTGYKADFLGKKFKVPLPEIKTKAKKKDILKFGSNGKNEEVLTYEHFSIVMSKSRRQCFYSAVNIDGKSSVGMKRGAWRLDPRIPADAQIMKECYGNAPKFSRGHMTRREDPIWGDADDASRGNLDSMHVTNTVPQMQGLNGGIWLGLENYALQNARKDDMRISVFTGPVFRPDDPVQYGIKIPVSFWKVIAFIHDDTGKLCATGYEISQEDFLSDNEFVFGKHTTAQRKISRIESETGLSFGNLSDLDPLNTAEEGLDEPPRHLTSLEEIRFI